MRITACDYPASIKVSHVLKPTTTSQSVHGKTYFRIISSVGLARVDSNHGIVHSTAVGDKINGKTSK
jgi:hypothetical protein